MKKTLLILVMLSTAYAFSQKKTFESEVRKISKRIDVITKQQKDSLKLAVQQINTLLDKGQMSFDVAEIEKKKAATYHAQRIETLVSIEQSKLRQLVQDKTDGKIFSIDDQVDQWNKNDDDDHIDGAYFLKFNVGNRTYRTGIVGTKYRWEKTDQIRRRWSKRTTSEFVFAMGVNNVLDKGQISSLDNSPYQFWRSRFYELGLNWKYRLHKEPSNFYLRYGFSFLWNNLRPDNQQFHVLNGNQTDLINFPTTTGELGDARLRHVQLIFPLHFEIDLSKKFTRDDVVYDRRNRSWRLGLGGFMGFKLGTRQYLEYRDVNRIKVKEVQKNNFNMNRHTYGLSAYLSHRAIGLYVKYDLNPLFQETEIRNISMGVRFDLD